MSDKKKTQIINIPVVDDNFKITVPEDEEKQQQLFEQSYRKAAKTINETVTAYLYKYKKSSKQRALAGCYLQSLRRLEISNDIAVEDAINDLKKLEKEIDSVLLV